MKEELKSLLRGQKRVSLSMFKEICEELVREGVFVKGRGVYRKQSRNHIIEISRLEAYDLIMGSGGRFLTAEFVKKDKTIRVINCQVLRHQEVGPLGYIKVKDMRVYKTDPEGSIRNMNIQTLIKFRTGKVEYRVK